MGACIRHKDDPADTDTYKYWTIPPATLFCYCCVAETRGRQDGGWGGTVGLCGVFVLGVPCAHTPPQSGPVMDSQIPWSSLTDINVQHTNKIPVSLHASYEDQAETINIVISLVKNKVKKMTLTTTTTTTTMTTIAITTITITITTITITIMKITIATKTRTTMTITIIIKRQ